jgi:hypothetical protein
MFGLSAADRGFDVNRHAPARARRANKKEWRGYFMWIYVMLDGA